MFIVGLVVPQHSSLVAPHRVGQNLYQSFNTRPADLRSEWSEAVTSWYSEVSMFPASSVSQYQFSPDTGHYSQLVWAATSRVGCGLTEFMSGRF